MIFGTVGVDMHEPELLRLSLICHVLLNDFPPLATLIHWGDVGFENDSLIFCFTFLLTTREPLCFISLPNNNHSSFYYTTSTINSSVFLINA